MDTLLIQKADINRLTTFAAAIDVNLITPHIYAAQEGEVNDSLGDELYTKILADYSTDSLVDDYLIIYKKYVVPMLVYFTCSRLVRDGGIRVDNGGLYYKVSDDKELPDDGNVARLRNSYRAEAMGVVKRFKDYMLANETITEMSQADKVQPAYRIPWELN